LYEGAWFCLRIFLDLKIWYQQNNNHMKTRLFVSILGAVLLVTLAGCAVTPDPLEDTERQQRIDTDLKSIFDDQEELKKPLSLSEAIARALKYNLDRRVKLMEEALAMRSLDVTRLDMLPAVVAHAAYNSRNNYDGSQSQKLPINPADPPYLDYNTSVEKRYQTNDITLVWNMLDFGLSYTRAQQQANQVLAAAEIRRKAIQNIVLDTQDAWWRAAAAQRHEAETALVLNHVRLALARSRQIERQRISDPLESLGTQKKLLELTEKMHTHLKEMNNAKVELAILINLKPGTPMMIDLPDEERIPFVPDMSMQELEKYALHFRPELREEDYNARNSHLEARKALLRMLPGLDISIGANHNTNKYLYNDKWTQAGVQIAWNIFNILSGPAAIRQAEAYAGFVDTRRLALSMAVLTQVHLAWRRYQEALSEFNIAKQLEDVESKIFDHTAAAGEALSVNEQDIVITRAAALRSKLRRGLAYAKLQNALGRIYDSIGKDIMPDKAVGDDLATLSKAILVHMNDVYSGKAVRPVVIPETKAE